ncbi:hypothetical protein LINGRAHAP2_LOCUS17608 [Linum grandiflorum]
MVAFVSKMAVATIMLISILSMAHGQDTRIISGPQCAKKCDDKTYNDNVARLLGRFVHETKHVRRGHHENYVYYHNFPNKDIGSVTGGAICDRILWGWQCESCLKTARKQIYRGCGSTTEASIELDDCSMWFTKIEPKV